MTSVDLATRALEYPAGEPVVFIRYRSEYEWKAGNDTLTGEDFKRSLQDRDALAAELAALGHRVYGVLWDSAEYRKWRAGQTDSPALRDEWAGEELLKSTPNHKLFTLGDPPAIERCAPSLRAIYGEGIGWADFDQTELPG